MVESNDGLRSTDRVKKFSRISVGLLVEIGWLPGSWSQRWSMMPSSRAVAASSGSLRITWAAWRARARRRVSTVRLGVTGVGSIPSAFTDWTLQTCRNGDKEGRGVCHCPELRLLSRHRTATQSVTLYFGSE